MKKILKLILIFTVFLMFSKESFAKTEEVYLGDPIDGVRLYLKFPTYSKKIQMYQNVNRSTGQLVYCTEPEVLLINGTHTLYQNTSSLDLHFDEEKWEYLKLITYYGYGYQDRTDLKWYVATQYLVWSSLLLPGEDIYFIDENDQKIDKYKKEIQAILEDVEKDSVIPSFAVSSLGSYNETGRTGVENVYVDKNNVLSDYKLIQISDTKGSARIEGNRLYVTTNRTAGVNITMRKTNNGLAGSILYKENSQVLISRHQSSKPCYLKISLTSPSVKVVKEATEETNLSLKGAVYEIKSLNGVTFKKGTTNELGEIIFKQVYAGDYYLEETQAPFGMKINPEKIYFTIEYTPDYEVYTIKTKDEVIHKKVLIEKYLENENQEKQLEPNAVFELYRGKELIDTIKTDAYGKINYDFTYGNYTLKQIEGKEGYQFIEDYSFVINEETSSDERIVLINKQKIGTLTVHNKDTDTLELLEVTNRFRIKNRDTNQYLEDIFTTKNGVFSTKLPAGEYILEEIEAPLHYLKGEPIVFEIKEHQEEITLYYFNEYILRTIRIEKYLENMNGTLLVEPNAVFELYNQDTMELIQTIKTNENGEILFELEYGNYLLKQVEGKKGYHFIEDFSFSINKDTTNDTKFVFKNVEIKVPVTIQVMDQETLKLILEEMKVQIREMNTNELVAIKDTTDLIINQGTLTILLPYGQYQIEEVEAPKDYQEGTNLLFDVKSEEELLLKLEYKKKTGSILIRKLDKDTKSPLPQVLFGLYDENNQLIKKYRTNKKGEILIENLRVGKYFIKELLAKKDYELVDETATIMVKAGIQSRITFTNRKKVEVPITGTSEFLFAFLGSTGMLLAGIFLCRNNEKKH